MPSTITINLSASSVKDAIKKVNDYKKSLNEKCELFCRKLISVAKVEASIRVSESPIGNTIVLSTNIKPRSVGCTAMLIGLGQRKATDNGTGNTMLFIEFGAGIHYNAIQNPKSGELGMGVGTFPNQTHAFDDGWWFKNDADEWIYSHGVKATMPMYCAGQKMREQIYSVAKEVFK